MSDPNILSRAGRRGRLVGGIAFAFVAIALGWYVTRPQKHTTSAENVVTPARPQPQVVMLSDSQLGAISVATIEEREFETEQPAIGNIDFNENRSVQVFSPYAGRVIDAFVDLGDDVRRGQVLLTVESPDFIAAESNLITAAATDDQAASALKRAKALYASKAIDQNDYEAAVANEQSAAGALHAARGAVAVFGRSEADMDHIVASRQVDTALVVRSPIAGRITARNVAPGTLVQPGSTPAPYCVADVSSMWMLAEIPETDIGAYRIGDPLKVRLIAYPGHLYTGRITAIGAAVDPSSRRVMLRSEIRDPAHELRAQMFASFEIRIGAPTRSAAIPVNGVVREGDGTMSVWVVDADPHRFIHRTVRIGRQQDGYDEILEGLKAGDRAAVNGAIFLSNILFGGAS